MLQKLANFYESEVDATVKALTSIMEPLMTVVVGGIIIAMYLPMFKIFELIE
jgi:type IV pilus assembly protein PilC